MDKYKDFGRKKRWSGGASGPSGGGPGGGGGGPGSGPRITGMANYRGTSSCKIPFFFLAHQLYNLQALAFICLLFIIPSSIGFARGEGVIDDARRLYLLWWWVWLILAAADYTSRSWSDADQHVLSPGAARQMQQQCAVPLQCSIRTI